MHFRCVVDNLDPQKRGHFQGCHPIRQHHYLYREEFLLFLVSRWRRPLDFVPLTLALCNVFIISMKRGHRVGCSPPSFQKKKKKIHLIKKLK